MLYKQYLSHKGGNMIFMFFGFTMAEAVVMMPRVVETLGLGHPKYSVATPPTIIVFDDAGKAIGEEKAIWVPGFAVLHEHPERLNALSQAFGDIAVTMVDAPVMAAIGVTLF